MSHQIYQTEGVVLGRKNFGEADSVFFIFTERFGRVDAVARGARRLESKLRCNLSLFSFCRFSLIAGKSADWRSWKIIDAEEIISPFKIISDSGKTVLFSRIAVLLNRMVCGEEKNAALWEEIKNFSDSLTRVDLGKKDLETLEISTVLRVLNGLGYIDKQQYSSKQEAISAINRAVKESHL